jgi:hypothetical protein
MRIVQPFVGVAALAGLMVAASPAYPGSCPPCGFYGIATTSGSIAPATADIGNHCDDCTTTVALPFPVHVYGMVYNSANVSSNGTVQFVSNISPPANTCLPSASHDTTIFAYWDDLRTDAQPGCSAYVPPVCGVFTSVTGAAPNRFFDIEWRAVHAADPAAPANFQVRLFENTLQNEDFQIVFGVLGGGGTSATAGVQCNNGSYVQQISCNTAIAQNRRFSFFCPFPVELTGFGVE